MIVTDKRKAVFLLYQEGMAVREIARRLALSRNTVRAIIRQEGTTPQPVRTTKPVSYTHLDVYKRQSQGDGAEP